MNDAPILAPLGASKSPAKTNALGTAAEPLSPLDDAPLDAAIAFAALLLENVDGLPADTLPGQVLPPEAGNILPVDADATPVIELAGNGTLTDEVLTDAVSPALPAAEATALAARNGAPLPLQAGLGTDVAGQIRNAKLAAKDRVVTQEPIKAADHIEARSIPAAQNIFVTVTEKSLPRADMMARIPSDAGAVLLDSQTSSANAAAIRAPATTTTQQLPLDSLNMRTFNIDAAVGDQDWGRQFSERVGWVIHAKLPNAQLRLNPEHLGPIEMSIEVDELQARVQFAAANGMTREAIEQQLPRLREMLEQQGLNLQQADVGDMARQDRQADADTADEYLSDASQTSGATDDAEPHAPVRQPLREVGLIDTFV